METQHKTHYKRLANPDYIGAYSLYDDAGKATDLNVSIASISKEEVKGTDGKKDMCTVARLHGQKPFIMNATNQKMLAKLFGSPFIEDWIGKPFTLYVTVIRVAGEPTECLRIRPKLPDLRLPELTPAHEKWQGAKTAIEAGNTTIEAIRKKYTLSPENEALLHAATI